MYSSEQATVRKVRLKEKKVRELMYCLKYNGRVSWTPQLPSQAKQCEDAAAPVCRQTTAKWHRVKPPKSEQHKIISEPQQPTSQVKMQLFVIPVSNKYRAYLFRPQSQQRTTKISLRFFWWYKANWAWGAGTQIHWSKQRKIARQSRQAPCWRESKFKCPFPGSAYELLLDRKSVV